MSARLAVGLLALAAVVAMWSRIVDSFVFQPSGAAEPELVERVGGENVFLRAEDGVRIHAVWLPAEGGGSADRAILFLHGNAGNLFHRIPNAVLLSRLGASVLLLDYRGYGLSEGTPSEAGVAADARAGLAHLVETRGLPESRIVLFGRSLGGAVAVELARQRGLAGVILESTFTSIADVVGLPLAPLLGGRFDAAARIGELRAPLLFFHGDRDGVVRFELGRRLFELAPEPKRFEPLPGAGHNDTLQVGGQPYLERIGRFLNEMAPRAGGPLR